METQQCWFVAAIAASMGVLGMRGDWDRGTLVEATGRALVDVGKRPADLLALEITASGATSVRKCIDLPSGGRDKIEVSGLPLGKIVARATAFPVHCLDRHEGTAPGWTSEAIQTTLTGGRLTDIPFVLKRNGL